MLTPANPAYSAPISRIHLPQLVSHHLQWPSKIPPFLLLCLVSTIHWLHIISHTAMSISRTSWMPLLEPVFFYTNPLKICFWTAHPWHYSLLVISLGFHLFLQNLLYISHRNNSLYTTDSSHKNAWKARVKSKIPSHYLLETVLPWSLTICLIFYSTQSPLHFKKIPKENVHLQKPNSIDMIPLIC